MVAIVAAGQAAAAEARLRAAGETVYRVGRIEAARGDARIRLEGTAAWGA